VTDARQRLSQGWQDPDTIARLPRPEEFRATAELLGLMGVARGRVASESEIQADTVACEQGLAQGQLCLVLEHERQIVGVFWGMLCRANAAEQLECHLMSVILRPELRTRGLGSRYLRHWEHCLGPLGVRAITLNFMAANGRVASFYRRLGYEHAGYDLLAPFENLVGAAEPGSVSSPALPTIRSYEPADAPWVAAQLYERQALKDFEHPFWSRSEIDSELQALAHDANQTLLLAKRGSVPCGLCWALFKLSRQGAPIAVARCFESDGTSTAGVLLDALKGFAASRSARESYVTLWEPCTAELELALARGYAVGRYKLSKRLVA
jgi:GNAT superfamily N-acetyltransferase